MARKPTGEEVSLETAELTALEGQGHRLDPEELGLLAKQLAKWLDTGPDVPEGQDLIKTFLLAGQHAKGARVS